MNLTTVSTLMIFSSHAIVDAAKLTFATNDGKIYVETDEKHFGLYGQVTDKDGVRIIAVNGNRYHYLTSNCVKQEEDVKDVNKDHSAEHTSAESGNIENSNLRIYLVRYILT